ncbi:hypothetical protein [Flavobacterium foetidum]|uniref:hypothetical protein n=1 Tax=Flavobacterium foetidum TaxID=2026681 RepID=UPI001074BA8A|nr:hypothetical protein [Flavobacterium foetidum]KAF2517926.1 hypothetical protein E0W73_01570 [Flavobacterium foetidum]
MKSIDKPFEEKQSVELAVGSFIIITFLFALYVITNGNSNVLILAWPFAVAAIIANSIMFFHLTEKFIKLQEQRKEIGFKIILLLSNIPITFVYYLVVMKL